MNKADVEMVLDCYPKIFWACHRRHVRDEKSKRVLSARQASVLDHLDAAVPMHLRELAGHLGVTASTMSLMIDRLERGGFVMRSRDAGKGGDKRRVNLLLTKAGARIKEQQKVLDPERVRGMLLRLDADGRERALAGLRILAGAASAMGVEGKIR